MLHTFNTTAYEIADFNYEQLNKYGFITLEDPEVPYMRWMTFPAAAISSCWMRCAAGLKSWIFHKPNVPAAFLCIWKRGGFCIRQPTVGPLSTSWKAVSAGRKKRTAGKVRWKKAGGCVFRGKKAGKS